MAINLSFNRSYEKNVPKSQYNMGHAISFEGQAGEVIPGTCLDVMPGDEVDLNFQLFTRLAPLVAPLNVNFKVDIRWFYVPFRLVYRDFNEMFMGNSITDAHVMPNVAFPTPGDFQTFYKNYGRLYQSFGLPQNDAVFTGANSSWLPRVPLAPLRAYNQIFYHYYLDSRKFSQTELDDIRKQLVVNTAAGIVTGKQIGRAHV